MRITILRLRNTENFKWLDVSENNEDCEFVMTHSKALKSDNLR